MLLNGELKVIGRAGVGLDNVDVPAATKAGVMVVNAPTSNITSAAELAVGLLLACARNIAPANEALKGVSLSIPLGETFGFIGPNGAGKSSMLNCINGVYSPQ